MRKFRIIIGVLLILLVTLQTASCGLLSSLGSDTTQSQEVVADNATVTSTSDTRQVSTQSQGSSSTGDIREVGRITTENVTGISPMWFIIGALILGMVIPQPKFIKALW